MSERWSEVALIRHGVGIRELLSSTSKRSESLGGQGTYVTSPQLLNMNLPIRLVDNQSIHFRLLNSFVEIFLDEIQILYFSLLIAEMSPTLLWFGRQMKLKSD